MTHLHYFEHYAQNSVNASLNFFENLKHLFSHSLMPVIRYNLRKLQWTESEKSSNWFLAWKCHNNPILEKIRITLKNLKQSILSTLWCLSAGKISEKSDERILRKDQKCWFLTQKCPIYTILGTTRMFFKNDFASFICLWNLNFIQNVRRK